MKKIIEIAELFIGLKEKPNNSGFYPHKPLENYVGMPSEEFMKTLGWQKKWAWCAFIPEAVWKLYYTQFDTSILIELDRLFHASVAQMEVNFKQSRFEWTITPSEGAIAIWRTYLNGKIQWSAHTALVTPDFTEKWLKTIDGNTNQVGSREGEICRRKSRPYSWDTKTGLRLEGFIKPAVI